jgi:hypothetical protein
MGIQIAGSGQTISVNGVSLNGRECHKVCVRRERMEPHAFDTTEEVLI